MRSRLYRAPGRRVTRAAARAQRSRGLCVTFTWYVTPDVTARPRGDWRSVLRTARRRFALRCAGAAAAGGAGSAGAAAAGESRVERGGGGSPAPARRHEDLDLGARFRVSASRGRGEGRSRAGRGEGGRPSGGPRRFLRPWAAFPAPARCRSPAPAAAARSFPLTFLLRVLAASGSRCWDAGAAAASGAGDSASRGDAAGGPWKPLKAHAGRAPVSGTQPRCPPRWGSALCCPPLLGVALTEAA